jgi:purine-nucleoside phosphorylase
MSIHISAKASEIAPIVLMPGDPLRAKHIADNMLDKATLVSSTRNIFFYTGTYQGTPLTIGASGMGCPSIGIYSYELYNEYDVRCIIRIGTAGAYTTALKLYDIINVDKAYSESTYAKFACNMDEDHMHHQGVAYDLINQTAARRFEAGLLKAPVLNGNIHSSDIFYRADPGTPSIAANNGCDAVEMESFALFANAKLLNKMAGTILTISDIIPTRESISADQRERSLATMMELALESTVEIHKTF